ncbi:hypothetical protein QYM36_007560, partial [Artemia franciscana]
MMVCLYVLVKFFYKNMFEASEQIFVKKQANSRGSHELRHFFDEVIFVIEGLDLGNQFRRSADGGTQVPELGKNDTLTDQQKSTEHGPNQPAITFPVVKKNLNIEKKAKVTAHEKK